MVNSISKEEKYCRKLLAKSSNISFDAACYTAEFSRKYLKELDGDLSANKKCFCPKCATPWIAGFFTSRLIPTPRSSKLKILLKRKKSGRLSRLDKQLLLAREENKNLQVITCTRCKYQFINSQVRPSKKEKQRPIIEEPEPVVRAKKKKRKKEKTAGLNLENIQINEPPSKIQLARIDLALDEEYSVIKKQNDVPVKSSNKKSSLKCVPFAISKRASLEANRPVIEKKKKKDINKLNRLQRALKNMNDSKSTNLASFLDSFR